MTDVERLVIGWINDSGICHAYLDILTAGSDLPTSYASVELTGGQLDGYGIMQPSTLSIQAWSDTRSNAKNLAYQLVPILIADHGSSVAGAEISNIVYFPSEDEKPRYQIMLQFTYQN